MDFWFTCENLSYPCKLQIHFNQYSVHYQSACVRVLIAHIRKFSVVQSPGGTTVLHTVTRVLDVEEKTMEKRKQSFSLSKIVYSWIIIGLRIDSNRSVD